MTTKSFFQTMSDGTEVCVNRWIPDDEAKAIIVISHGMAEHSLRYDGTASFFADAGFIVSAHDHRGHGKTAQKQIEKGQPGFGYLADKHGYEKVRDDLLEVIQQVKKDFPGKKVILLGHSFGSFITQSFIENYSDQIDACILCGSSGPIPPARLGVFLSNICYLFGQKKRKNNTLGRMAFAGYNNHIKNAKSDFEWLSRDEQNVQMYIADQWCGFDMTTEFYHEMFRILTHIHKIKNIKKISRDLPIYIMSGKEDPVSSYGKSLENLYNTYKSIGIKSIDMKLYPEDRHEILNEVDKETVISDTLAWINSHI
ncbi:alpha/beta fold hydrolase [Treponema sp.]|uniref:alpha/beta fold hydrolase n=1 Tax=Treponema sp. TaxID=166 RepID=UPI00298E8F3A|nr:alpha/beta fold hydrolase [Treponema sp.]MCR5613924.1 lysophospholipase [Treponema sp.]